MNEYHFVLKFALSHDDRDHADLVERLGEVGCTDATVGIGTTGLITLDFARDAETAERAVGSALAAVKIAIPSARLVEASPDLVGLTDIAERMGMARQNIRKLWTTNEDFPIPVYSGSMLLWHLADILDWLKGRKGYVLDPSMVETAEMTRVVNTAKERRRDAPRTILDALSL